MVLTSERILLHRPSGFRCVLFELVWRARYMLAAAPLRALRGSRWLSCAHSTRTCQPSGREALRLPSGRAYTSPLHSAVVRGTGPKSPRSLQRSHVAPRRSPSLPSGGAVSSSHAGLGAGLIARGPGFKAPQVPRGPAVQAAAVRHQAAANRVGATDSRAVRLGVGVEVRGGASHVMSRASKLSPRPRVYTRRVDVPRRVPPPKPVASQKEGQCER